MKQNSVHDRKKKSKATDKKATQQLPAGIKQQVISMGWSNVLRGEMKQWDPLWATWKPHWPAALHLPVLRLLGCAAWQQEVPATVLSQRCFSQRNVQWQGKWYWPWIPGMPGIIFFFAYHPKHTVLRLQNYVTGNIITQWTLSLKVVNAIRGTVSTGASMRTLRTLHKHT